MASRPDDAVRRYLVGLKDPSAVRADTAELDARIAASDDPLERLQLHAEKAQFEDPMRQLEEEFTQHAKSYADAKGIPVDAFRAEGVADGVLRKAGFSVARRRRAGGGAPRSSKPRVAAEDVRRALPRKKSTFTIASLRASTGASPATVRKLVRELIAEGAVEEIGPDPDTSGPGRAAIIYRRIA